MTKPIGIEVTAHDGPRYPGDSRGRTDQQRVMLFAGDREKYEQTILSQQPIAYYQLNENGTVTATDSSGHANHGQVVGAVQPLASGSPIGSSNTSYDFNGGQIQLSLPEVNLNNNVAIGDTTNTVSAWMYFENSGERQSLFSFHVYNFSIGHFVSSNIPNGADLIGFNTGAGDLFGAVADLDAYADQWIHVAAVFDNRTPANSRLFLNGQEKSLSQLYGPFTTVHGFATTDAAISGWRIGGSERFAGLIDEVAVFNRALTAVEIAAQFGARWLSDIHGSVAIGSSWLDQNKNGRHDESMAGIEGVLVFADFDDDGAWDDRGSSTSPFEGIVDATGYTEGSIIEGQFGAVLSVDQTDAGTYTVTVAVTDDHSTVTDQTTVVVHNREPFVRVFEPSPIHEGSALSLVGQASDAVGEIDPRNIGWFVNDRPLNVHELQLQLTWDELLQLGINSRTDRYSVGLRATDDEGFTLTNLAILTVKNVPPQSVNAGADVTIAEGNTASFAVSFTDPGTHDTHDISWQVVRQGETTVLDSGSGREFSFRPTDNGTFLATVTVTDSDGASPRRVSCW